MQKPNIIVFDVDNTLIKGNLTLFFLQSLIKERFFFFYRCLFLLLKGAYLTLRQLPAVTKKTLVSSGNIYLLDRNICMALKTFYKTFVSTLKKLDLVGIKLEKKAAEIFYDGFFAKHSYAQGFVKIKEHLVEPNTIVVLLSGSPQELVNVFYDSLCKQLTKEKLDWQGKFFARGTDLSQKTVPNDSVTPCIGSEKNKMLKKLLTANGHPAYTITYIYSDNNFMADLPLLIESQNGGMLISKKTSLYSFLPKSLTKNFIFLPSWNHEG